MSKKSYWIKNGIITISQNLLSVILSFLSFYFLVRLLTKEQYGAWVLFLSITGIMEWSRNGFTQEALIKYLASANRVDSRKIISASFIINSILTVVVILIVIILGPQLARSWNFPEITTLLYLYIVGFLFTGISGLANNIEQANLSFTGIFYSSVARQLVFFLYVFYCYITSSSTTLVYLTYAQIISIFIAVTIALLRAKKHIKLTKKIDKEWIAKIFNFGKYTFGVSLSSMLASSIDQMMLGSMVSKASSGIFNIAVRVTNLTNIPTTSLASILYPQSARRSDKEGPQVLKYLFEKSVGVNLAILLPFIIFTFAFADIIIPLIASTKYVESIPLLRITLLGAIIAPYAMQTGTILTSAGHTKFNFYLVIISLTSLIVLNFLLIKSFGIIGAAYASIASAVISVIICQIYLKKNFGINFLNPWIYAYKFYPEFYYTYIGKKRK